MKNDIAYEFFYWGPFLWRTKLPAELIDEILKRGLNNRMPANNVLASDIDNVKSFDKTDLEWLNFSLSRYFNLYKDLLTKYTGTFDHTRVKDIKLSHAWVNFQKQYESNPEHIHDSDFSFVVYLKVPDSLKQEHEKFQGTGAGPGGITFRYGEEMPNVTTRQMFFPEVGDMYMFQGSLAHWVTPFKSENERISLAGNIIIVYND